MVVKRTKVEVYGETSKYEQSMRNVHKTGKSTAERLERAWNTAFGNINRVLGVFGVAGVAGFTMIAKQALESGDKIHKLNLRLGVSTETLSQLQHAAKLSGLEFEEVAKAYQKMQEGISDAATGIGTAKDSLQDLGLEIKTLKEMSPEQQLDAIADAIQGVTNNADRVRIAADIFGMRGVGMLQMLSDGSEGLRKMREEFNRLGRTLSKTEAQEIAAANDALTRIKTSVSGISMSLIIELAPAITEVSDNIAEWVAQNRNLLTQKVPEYMDKTKTALTGIVDVYNALPDGVVGAAGTGIIVRMLTGSHPLGWLVTGLMFVNTQLERYSMNIGSLRRQASEFRETISSDDKFIASLYDDLDKTLAHFGMGDEHMGEQTVRRTISPKIKTALRGPEGAAMAGAPMIAPDESAMKDADDIRNRWLLMEMDALIEQEQKKTELTREHGQVRLAMENDFNRAYQERTMSRFDIERQQVLTQTEMWRNAGLDKIKIAQFTSNKIRAIDRAEKQEKFAIIQGTTQEMANNFQEIAEMSSKHNKAAFAAWKSFKIVETTIATITGAEKAAAAMAGIPIIGPALAVAAYISFYGAGMAAVAEIVSAKPPSYDDGGISMTPGYYYAGIPEAHVPLKGGAIPVTINGGGDTNIIMNNPTFMDQETLSRSMSQIAQVAVQRGAPAAVYSNYQNDGLMRGMIRERR